MRESVFDKINRTEKEPVEEYFKINSFSKTKKVFGYISIYDVLKEQFTKCRTLRKHYSDLDESIKANTTNIYDFISGPTRDIYGNIYDISEDKILNDYLNYCEIICTMLRIFTNTGYETTNYGGIKQLDMEVLKQFYELIETSLTSFGYKTTISLIKLSDETDEEVIKIIKINPVAEFIAEQSEPTIQKAILGYLGIRANNIEEKEKQLLILINLLEPIFDKYNSQNNIKKVKEYAQILRHPEKYKSKQEYSWYYKDKGAYVDDIFTLCLYVQHHVIYREIIKKFDKLKKQNSSID